MRDEYTDIIRKHQPECRVASECDCCGYEYEWSCSGCYWSYSPAVPTFTDHLLDLLNDVEDPARDE